MKLALVRRWMLAVISLLPAALVGFVLTARPDALHAVAPLLPAFATCLGVTSILALYFVLSVRVQFLLPLLAGPLLASLIYVAGHGLSDPSWYTLLSLLTIGMLVGTPVTGIWAVLKQQRPGSDESC